MFAIRFCRATIAGPAIALALASAAHAEPFLFTMNGYFYSGALSGVPFAAGTPFTETALFDTSSTNLITQTPGESYLPGNPNPITNATAPGSVIYVPSSAAITIGGTTYQMAPYSASTPYGVGVAIFDKTDPFPAVPEYGVALIGNPINDGAGILADFLYATPEVYTTNLTSTVFPANAYVGSGITSGVCTSAEATCFSPFQVRDIEPVPLTANGMSYQLTFTDGVSTGPFTAGYPDVLETLDTEINDPNAPPPGFGLVISTPFSASLVDVPEPSPIYVMGAGLGALLLLRRFRRA